MKKLVICGILFNADSGTNEKEDDKETPLFFNKEIDSTFLQQNRVGCSHATFGKTKWFKLNFESCIYDQPDLQDINVMDVSYEEPTKL